MIVRVAARDSLLSKAQCREVEEALSHTPISFSYLWMKTTGDLDKKTSLRDLGQTDFFTKEIDEALLEKRADVAIHSAKDLPLSMKEGLEVIAITQGVDPRDALVFRGEKEPLFAGAKIGVSSLRRENILRHMQEDLQFFDIRGTIEERLELLTEKLDGVVIAESAILRLQLTHLPRIYLPGSGALLQGKLAMVARRGDKKMKALFSPLNEFS